MFLDLINDIEKALEAELYLPALALSLTLPDICGKIEFPDSKKVEERYTKWYDKYITNNNYPTNYYNTLKFDGAKCYKLRCAFLHSGEVEQIDGIENFELIISKKTHPFFYVGGVKTTAFKQNETPIYTIQQDVAQLCFWIYRCARGFYEDYPDKKAFEKINPIIKFY